MDKIVESEAELLNYFQRLLFIYIVLSFLSEISLLVNMNSFLIVFKMIILSAMVMYSALNFSKSNLKLEKKYIYILLFFFGVQLLNILLSINSYQSLENLFTSISYVLFIWIFFFYYQLYPYKKKMFALRKLYLLLYIFLVVSVGLSLTNPESLYTNIGERFRFSFGFINTNRLASLLFIIINLGWLVSNQFIKKSTRIFALLSLLLPVVLLILTDSRTPLLLILIEIILFMLAKFKLLTSKGFILSILLWLVSLITFLFLIKFKNYTLFEEVNNLTSGRLYIWKNILENLNGSEFYWGLSSELTSQYILQYYNSLYQNTISIDNFYINILFNYGIISLLLFMIFIMFLALLVSRFTSRFHKVKIFILLFVILIYSFMEGFLISVNNITSIIFWLCLASTLDSQKLLNGGRK